MISVLEIDNVEISLLCILSHLPHLSHLAAGVLKIPRGHLRQVNSSHDQIVIGQTQPRLLQIRRRQSCLWHLQARQSRHPRQNQLHRLVAKMHGLSTEWKKSKMMKCI